MIQFLGSLSLGIGIGTSLLNLLDFVLTDKQKKNISSLGDTLWIWLAHQQSAGFVQKFWSRSFQRWLSVIGFLIVILLMVWVGAFFGMMVMIDVVQSDVQTILTEVDERVFLLLPLAMIIAMIVSVRYVHPWCIGRLKIPVTIGGYLKKTARGLCISSFILLITLILFVIPLLNIRDAPNEVTVLYFFLFAIIGAVAGAEPFLFLTMLFLCVVWVPMVHVIIFLFRVVQFFLLRISENPKGLVAAVSGVLTAIGGVIKFVVT